MVRWAMINVSSQEAGLYLSGLIEYCDIVSSLGCSVQDNNKLILCSVSSSWTWTISSPAAAAAPSVTMSLWWSTNQSMILTWENQHSLRFATSHLTSSTPLSLINLEAKTWADGRLLSARIFRIQTVSSEDFCSHWSSVFYYLWEGRSLSWH